MLNELFLEHRRQEDAKKRTSRSKKRRARSPGLPSSLVRSPARPREFVNSRSKFAELGPPFSVSMALHPFPGLAGPSLSPSLAVLSTIRSAVPSRGEWARSGRPVSPPAPPCHVTSPLYPRAVSCLCSHASHHRRLPREELERSLPPSVRTIMKDINYNFISNYRWNTFQITWA